MIEPLTARQMEVLRAYADLLSFRLVAERLFMSVYTVKSHAAEIRVALGAPSLCAAVIQGLREGWLT